MVPEMALTEASYLGTKVNHMHKKRTLFATNTNAVIYTSMEIGR